MKAVASLSHLIDWGIFYKVRHVGVGELTYYRQVYLRPLQAHFLLKTSPLHCEGLRPGKQSLAKISGNQIHSFGDSYNSDRVKGLQKSG